jgi:hypothetical protein
MRFEDARQIRMRLGVRGQAERDPAFRATKSFLIPFGLRACESAVAAALCRRKSGRVRSNRRLAEDCKPHQLRACVLECGGPPSLWGRQAHDGKAPNGWRSPKPGGQREAPGVRPSSGAATHARTMVWEIQETSARFTLLWPRTATLRERLGLYSADNDSPDRAGGWQLHRSRRLGSPKSDEDERRF